MQIIEVSAEMLPSMTNDQLAQAYDQIRYEEELIKAKKEVLKTEILDRLKADGEVWGEYTVTKVTKTTFVNVPLDEARKYAAVKESVDSTILSKLKKKGMELPFETKETVYPQVKLIKKEE